MNLTYIYCVSIVIQTLITAGLCYGRDVAIAKHLSYQEQKKFLGTSKWMCLVICAPMSVVPFLSLVIIAICLRIIIIDKTQINFLVPFGIGDRKLMRSINPEMQQRLDL